MVKEEEEPKWFATCHKAHQEHNEELKSPLSVQHPIHLHLSTDPTF